MFSLMVFFAACLVGDIGPHIRDLRSGAAKDKASLVKQSRNKQSGTRQIEKKTPPTQQNKKNKKTFAKGGKQKPTYKKLPAVPDLRAMIAEPINRVDFIERRFKADQGSLMRRYTISLSPTRHQRMKRFYRSWRIAVKKVDRKKLNKSESAALRQLNKTIAKHIQELDEQAASQKEIAPLVPFAALIIELEESRRRMEPVDARKAAGQIAGLSQQLVDLRLKLLAKAKDKSKEIQVATALAKRAAKTTNSLRRTLKNWFSFYNNYDPLFTWWVAKPYKAADEALSEHADFLEDDLPESAKSANLGSLAAPAQSFKIGLPRTARPDAPDLNKMLATPQSELAVVIDKYQDSRKAFGSLSRSPFRVRIPRTPERTAQLKKYVADWDAAVDKIAFDKLSQEGKIDLLLFRQALVKESRRLDNPLRRRTPSKKRDPRALTGKPIGRAALQRELAAEMIPYTPEEMIAIAEKEFAWCDAEMKKAAREMGFGEWRKALEKVKTLHVAPGKQPELVRDLAREAVAYVKRHGLVTVPPLAGETWRMEMLSPEQQLISPFFLGGEVIRVSYPTDTMPHDARLQSMRGNNIHFSRATVHHELIPGHHLQGFMNARCNTHRRLFRTPFWTEGWALYWEMRLYALGFPKTPEDRVGFLFWRSHRCARIIFSLNFHMEKWAPQKCVDFLVQRVGHEPDNAAAEVRRSIAGRYGALYQAAYMLGGLQFRALKRELVDTGKMTDRQFHDAILQGNHMPVALVRARLTGQPLSRDFRSTWRFYGELAMKK